MVRFLIACCVAGWLAGAALSATVKPGELNGGGSTSYLGGFRLAGDISPYGLGGGTAGVSQNASNKISQGFYPVIGPIVTRNVADPAWLKVARSENRADAAKMTAWREPENNRESFDVTGWQL
ncbi:hypothetical protein LLG95_15575 [bacterium]|nr:hypothetical protein [bacterium]